MGNLNNYRKIVAARGQGFGPNNYVAVYNTGDNTITRVFSISVCNSDANEETFRLWQIPAEDWQTETLWDTGGNVEPGISIKDRIFYDVLIPENLTYLVEHNIILHNKQYLILEASDNISITLWGEEEGPSS